MSVKKYFKKLLRQFGFDIIKFTPSSHPIASLKLLLNSYQIDLVLDVGANIGQFGEFLRQNLNYKKDIISFEPLYREFEILKSKVESDKHWTVYNIALGDFDGTSEINVSENSYSSSILNMMLTHLEAAPNSRYIRREPIKVKKLDSIFDNICHSSKTIFMKIDTQGFEDKVLKGAEESLQKIPLIQLEMSLTLLYDGQILFDELFELMKQKNMI